MPHDIEFVLDDEKRIPGGLEAVQRAQQRLGVGRMKSSRRLVQNVNDPEQVGSNLCRQAKPLQFARRQRGRASFRCQIAETEVEQHFEPRQQIFHDPLDNELPFRDGRPRLSLAVQAGFQTVHRAPSAAAAKFRLCPCPAKVTESASGFSRLPLQTGQSVLERNCATRRFIIALCVVAKVCRTYFRAPVKVP